MADKDGGHQLLWMDETGEEEEEDDMTQQRQGQVEAAAVSSEQVQALESELQRTRRELAEVRKELAAKTVQLSRKEQVAVQEKAQEIAASVAGEKERQMQQLMQQISQLEVAVAQREEELEESRRLYHAQKKALREALNAVAEREAAERSADEATRTAAAWAVEDELDKVHHELVLTKTRAELELKARDTQLQMLQQELAALAQSRKQAISEAEQALNDAWSAEVEKVQTDATSKVSELESELVRLKTQMEDMRRSSDNVLMTGELAALNNQKVQIQREFEAFRDMAMQTTRSNREEVARLLEENALLHSRLAAKAMDSYMASSGPAATPTPPAATSKAPPRMFDSMAQSYQQYMDMEAYLPEVLARIERQRKGLVPALILSALIMVFVLTAVIRAAASAKSEHRGGLCFLAKLGIRIGKACGEAEKARQGLVELIDKPQRVHDVADSELPLQEGGPKGAARRLLGVVGQALFQAAAEGIMDGDGAEHDEQDPFAAALR